MRLLLLLLLTACSYDGATLSTDKGDIAIPLQLNRINFTICKALHVKEDSYTEYHCVEIYTDKKFILSVEEWWKVKHNFVWASSQEISERIAQDEFIEEHFDNFFKGKYETLNFLEGYKK